MIKKLFSMTALIVVLLATVSAHTDINFPIAYGINAPRFEVKGEDGLTISPSDIKGRYIIVNFWTAMDADSRIAANLYDDFVGGQSSGEMSLISVNIDEDRLLAGEIIRRDGLSTNSQYTIDSGKVNDVIRQNGLDRGINTYVINPEGRIVAVNPSIATIRSLLEPVP